MVNVNMLTNATERKAFDRFLAAGNRTSKTALQQADPTPVSVLSQYSYDNIYQLTQTLVDQSLAESYTYDAVGNRLTSLDPATYTYNSSNQLTATSAATYTYDYNGNTLSKTDTNGTTSYTWDYENRLTQVTLPGQGGTVYFNYDPFGRRIRKVFGSTTTIYAYDGDDVIDEFDAGGSLLARYVRADDVDEPLAMYRGLATAYFHADALGSITSLTDGSGQLSASYVYDSFGKPTASTGTITNPFQYTGREFDSETGIYYYRARYYDPITGRFLSEDPIRFGGGVDFYRYAFNNSVNFEDPFGLDANTWTYGEIRSYAIGPPPGYAPPQGLGDAKASIGAVCSLNGICADVDGSRATAVADQAAWRNVTAAAGTDRSGGGNFMCVGTQNCWFVTKCYQCVNGAPTKVNRTAPLQPSGTVGVGGHTLYFYSDPLRGWCNENDYRLGCCRH
jgi:RHS repeat-associated protein